MVACVRSDGVVPETQRLIDRLEEVVSGDGPDEESWYGWAPLPLLDFYEGMRIARAALGPGPHRFLDVGAGIGSKVFLADVLGFEAHGIDHSRPYLEAARRLVPDLDMRAGDALTFDEYGAYDLIYSYRIAIAPDLQETVNRYIADRLRRGALFFCAGGPYPDWLDHVGGQVWRA